MKKLNKNQLENINGGDLSTEISILNAALPSGLIQNLGDLNSSEDLQNQVTGAWNALFGTNFTYETLRQEIASNGNMPDVIAAIRD